MTEPM